MALDSLLASLKSGVAEVTGVQASRNMAFACNLAPIVRVAKVAGVAAEIQTATPETPDGHFKIPHLWPPKIPQAGPVKF
jgi:hypothetical protein